jgi:hypothetical protein
MAEAAVSSKDVIVAILGAAVSLAGLLLIFSGFLFTQAWSFPATTSDRIINRVKNAGRVGILPFVFALVVAAGSTFWLLNPSVGLYSFCVKGFIGLLIGTGVYGVFAVLAYV